MEKTCIEFIATYRSSRITCFSCKNWNHDDFVCMDKEEIAKRDKENVFDAMNQMMRRNKAVFIE